MYIYTLLRKIDVFVFHLSLCNMLFFEKSWTFRLFEKSWTFRFFKKSRTSCERLHFSTFRKKSHFATFRVPGAFKNFSLFDFSRKKLNVHTIFLEHRLLAQIGVQALYWYWRLPGLAFK